MNDNNQQAAREWLPIDETTPVCCHVLVWDGRTVSHSYHGKVSHVPIYGWLNLYCDPEDCSLMDPQPTHWQPLPTPPDSGEK